ncbi:MAG: complex I subunit 1 family protein [Polyangiaceae bacterium]
MVELVLAIVKILIVVGFCLQMSGLATWAERRQSAMIQHRVGPNRAVVELPSFIIRGALATPGALIGAIAVLGLGRAPRPEAALDRMGISLQLLVLVTWFNLVLLSWRVNKKGALNAFESAIGQSLPRTYFYTGLVAHVAAFGLSVVLNNRFKHGLMSASETYFAARIAAILLGAVLGACGVYASLRVPPGKIGVRLAGTIHGIADVLKMMFKEDFIPKKADRLLHSLGPLIAMFPCLVVMGVTPFGDTLCFKDANHNGTLDFSDLAHLVPVMARDGVCEGHAVRMQIIDLNVGILYIFAMSSTGVIGAAVAGWSSDNKFSLLGGLRAASQMVSYEVAMGLSLMGLFLVTNAIRLGPIVDWQNENAWGIFVQPVAFFLFMAAAMAETKRVPFDQPEGESEIVAGYFVEYSGFKMGMFMASEYVELITSSALIVTLFLGGYSLPFLFSDGLHISIGNTVIYDYRMNHAAVSVIQALTFFGKTTLFTFVQIFFRWTLPRFRYDQLMKFGWTKLLPLSIANVVVTAVIVVGIDSAGPGLHEFLGVVGQLTQVLVGIGLAAIPVAFVWLLLRPVQRTQFVRSTSARLAAAAGGVKPSPMQA